MSVHVLEYKYTVHLYTADVYTVYWYSVLVQICKVAVTHVLQPPYDRLTTALQPPYDRLTTTMQPPYDRAVQPNGRICCDANTTL